MTYNDVKLRVYDILSIPEDEARRMGYIDKIPRAFNEAAFRIAHSVLPNLREYTICITRDKLPARVSMPPDFISFADEQDAYLNGENFVLTNFIGKSDIIITGEEAPIKNTTDNLQYTFFYNASYPKIVNDGKNFEVFVFSKTPPVNEENYLRELWLTEDSQETETFDIPDILGNLAAHYIVSQVLVLDDKVRSITEQNNFETLLASIDTHRNERQRHYHSVRGWY